MSCFLLLLYMKKNYYSISEFCEKCGVSKSTLYRYHAAGLFPFDNTPNGKHVYLAKRVKQFESLKNTLKQTKSLDVLLLQDSYSVMEFSIISGVPVKTLYRWNKTGVIQFMQDDTGRLYATKHQLISFLKNGDALTAHQQYVLSILEGVQ